AGKGQVHEGPISTKLGLKGIPALAEELQIARDLFILEYTGGKLHIPTISTANSVKLIAAAKKKGLDVSCSAAIHNLWYTDSALESFDSKYKTMPPLREKVDTRALINGLKSGTVDFVTTDHSPMNIEYKELEFDNAANGTIGLESAFGILNQLFDIKTVINLLTKGRNRFGLNKINFEEGEEARMTLFNPATNGTFNNENIASTSKNSMFVGEKLKGEVLGVICSGKIGLNPNHFN
ncbi:MAG: dihydroorotase, partial [Aurantibacter sp.]